MTRWDAARASNNYRTYKPVKPVGEDAYNLQADNDRTCRSCGHLLCSCPYVPPPYGATKQLVPIEYNAFLPRDVAYYLPNFNIQCGLVKKKDLDKIREWIENQALCGIQNVL